MMSVLQMIVDRVHLLEHMLAQGADINEKDEDGDTAMHIAIMDNMEQEVFDILLKYGATIDTFNNLNVSPFFMCVGTFDPVLKLLRAEKKFPLKDSLGNTIMHWLLGPEGDSLFNLILHLEREKSEEGEPYYCVPNLSVQVFWNSLLAEKHEMNIDTITQNKEGKTILHIAAASGYAKTHLQILLAEFPDVNPCVVDKDGNTFLHIYFAQKNIYIFKEIIKIFDEACETFEEKLLQGQMAPCSKQVIKKILCSKNAMGETPLHLYFENVKRRIDVTLLSLFIDAGADFSLKNNDMETLLHKHVRYQFDKDTNEEVAKTKVNFLVNLGVDVNGQDMLGNSPIYYAETEWAVLTLLDNGADIKIQNKTKQTPLLWFVCKDFAQHSSTIYNIIMPLIEQGSDVNAQDMHGNTVLHYAAWNYGKDVEIVSILRENNAENLTDCLGNLPCDVASERGHLHLIEMLCNCPPKHHPTTRSMSKVLSLKQITKQSTKTLRSLKKDFESQYEQDFPDLLERPVTGCVQWGREESEIKAAVTETVQRLCNILSNQKPFFSGKLIQSGSVGDGSKVGLPDEFDFVYVLDNLGSMVTVEETKSNDQSFIRLKKKAGIHNPELDQFIRKFGYLNAGDTWEAISYDLLKLPKVQSVFSHTNIWPNYEPNYEPNIGFSFDFSANKPNINFKVFWVGKKYKVLQIDIDLVLAIDTKGFWPKNARKGEQFFNLDKIKSEGVIALVQTDDLDKQINFRLSALLAEKSVLNGLPKIAKDAYNIAKIMLTNEICPQISGFTSYTMCAKDVITSYMIKTALLHVLDEHRDYTIMDKEVVYTAEDLKIVVMRLFQKLLQYSKQEHLPNFFFGWQNVFTFKPDNQWNDKQIYQNSCYRQLFLKLLLAMLGDQQDLGEEDVAFLIKGNKQRKTQSSSQCEYRHPEISEVLARKRKIESSLLLRN